MPADTEITKSRLEDGLCIGHPKDDEFPVETVSTAEFMENPRRLYEQESVVALAQSLGLPYNDVVNGGEWVWVNGSDLDEDQVAFLDRAGFTLSKRRGPNGEVRLFHKCEHGSTDDIAWTQPDAEAELEA